MNLLFYPYPEPEVSVPGHLRPFYGNNIEPTFKVEEGTEIRKL